MKCAVYTIVIALLFASCGGSAFKKTESVVDQVEDSVECTVIDTETGQGGVYVVDSISADYTANAALIGQSKQEMLGVADSVGGFWFSDDVELQSQDPHAYWLMNRMMQMRQLVSTADDDWAWMLAMNESVKGYNARLGRKIGSVDAAVRAIHELIGLYGAGSQAEMNTASYVVSVLEHYSTVYTYYCLINSIHGFEDGNNWNLRMRALYYKEFKEWFALNDAVYRVMCDYTYAPARYSSLSLDLNGAFENWSKARFNELEIERDIFWTYNWTAYESDAEIVSPKEFDELLGYFKRRTMDDVVEEIVDDWVDKNYALARERIGYCFDFEVIAETLERYVVALDAWRAVREQIALMLPEEKRESYREISNQMHSRLYNELSALKEIHY